MAKTTTDPFTSDNRIAQDLALTDSERATIVKIANKVSSIDPQASSIAVMALRIDRLEQRVTDLMKAETRKHGGV